MQHKKVFNALSFVEQVYSSHEKVLYTYGTVCMPNIAKYCMYELCESGPCLVDVHNCTVLYDWKPSTQMSEIQ